MPRFGALSGKTTFIRLLAGLMPADEDPETGEKIHLPEFNVSYKPQKIAPKFESTVRNLLHAKVQNPACALFARLACHSCTTCLYHLVPLRLRTDSGCISSPAVH